jgi:hypothetical protein
MVRTKRARVTTASRQKETRVNGKDAGIATVATGGESLQEIQSRANSKVIGNALFGEATCAQLMTKQKDDTMPAKEPESACNGFSQAAAWAAESEWTGEASEETAETGSGSREPED